MKTGIPVGITVALTNKALEPRRDIGGVKGERRTMSLVVK
jgi:hypothetical protein